MCLAVPGKVVEIAGSFAIVEIEGKQSRVSLSLLPDDQMPAAGDYLVSHLGMALSRIDEAEALELMAMIREVAGTEVPEQIAL